MADPRKIWLTKIAKRHLQLRPGSDVWLINAMMNVILEEGLENEEYIREFTDDFEALREVVSRYTPEEAEQVTGVPAEDIRATAREYATERHAAVFYTLGITEHACGVDNIWSLSNLVLMTGHLGYESTGLNALRGQNNVQGLNDSGANPAYLHGYQAVDEPEVRKKFSEAWGVEVPETPGYRLDQMMSGLHDGRIKALYLIGENPAQTEPNAHHVEEGLAQLEFIVSQDIFLNDMTRALRGRRPAGVELRREGRDVHEHRAADQPRARRRSVPGQARVDRDIVIDAGPCTGCQLAGLPGRRVGLERDGRPRAGVVRRSATTGWRSRGCSGLRPSSAIPARRFSTRRGPPGRADVESSSRSSTSRRSSSPTPSTRSSSTPAARSTTTTRRR